MPGALRGGWIRASSRLAGAGLWTLGWAILWSLGAVLLFPVSRQRLRWRQWSVRHWARGAARVTGMRRLARGTPPEPPFVLVTNHLSYLDILLLHSTVRGVFVAKLEMRTWPLLGLMAHLTGTIWLNREVRRDTVRVLDRIGTAVSRGDGVILFPEGTTSSGEGLLPMKSALLDWAAREQFPVHCGAITYRTGPGAPPASQVLCWWGDMTFGSHLMNLLRLRRFDGIVEFAPEPITAPTRGELTRRLAEAITGRLVPVPTGGENRDQAG